MEKFALRFNLLTLLIIGIALLVWRLSDWSVIPYYGCLLGAGALLILMTAHIIKLVREYRAFIGPDPWRQCRRTVGAIMYIFASSVMLVFMLATVSVPVEFFRSPDRNRELVVTRNPRFAVYNVCPSAFHLFGQGSGKVFKAKWDIPVSSIDVRWQDGSARVYFIYDPTKGPVEEDSIFVSFDSTES